MVTRNFIELKETGVSASATIQINLSEIRDRYEAEHFNILTILNTSSATPLTLILDGKEVAYIPANNGVFEIKPEYNLKFNLLALKNDTANVLTNEIKIILGYTAVYDKITAIPQETAGLS